MGEQARALQFKASSDKIYRKNKLVENSHLPFSPASSNDQRLYRKSSCACGGGCPSCQAKSNSLKVSSPGDAAEIEADRIADKVMRMPSGESEKIRSEAAPVSKNSTIYRKCDACENDEETIQRKPLALSSSSSSTGGGAPPQTPQTPAHVQSAIDSGGRPLDGETRGFFEPRLGYDLSSVRVHTGSAAGESARAIDAKAYTLGSDIVFGSGEYDPVSETGRHLIAHELAHTIQQNVYGKQGTLHRRLKVNAAASDDPATAISMIDPLITSLCPDFQTNSTTGQITPRSGTPCSIPRFRAVAASSNPLGCCCLCTMTRPWGANWEIIVSATEAPATSESAHTVRMTPTSGPNAPELRHWTTGPAETLATQSPAEAFGHELCGHAALLKIHAHADRSGDRSYDDEHDPTVRIQNALATEMGVPGTRRGLAGGGAHRGESLRVFTVGPFSANTDDPAPFSAQIAAAVAFLNGKPELLVDTIGFRDGADTTAGVSASRAGRVRTAIAAGVAVPDVSVETTPGVNETLTRIQPAIDGGAGGSAIVELRMAIRPAGLQTPIGAAPPAVPVHIDATDPARVRALKGGSVNECHQLLANTAWP